MVNELIALPIFMFLVLVFFVLVVLLMVFWIWMIVDVAKRDFKDETEKIVWILVVILAGILGAIIYYFVIKQANPKGVSKK